VTRQFCTYFDKRYLVRALALYLSLRKHCASFTLSALCLDAETHTILADMGLPGMQLIALEELERDDPALLDVKSSRKRLDYYFTLTPALALMLLSRSSAGDVVTYLDADLYFFRDPEPLFSELEGHSVGIIAHRFPRDLEHLARKFGMFNVAWVSFRNDEEGDVCARWWREQCLTWCHEKRAENRFADQKYLDDWPQRFSNVRVIQHKGANLAFPGTCETMTSRGPLKGRALMASPCSSSISIGFRGWLRFCTTPIYGCMGPRRYRSSDERYSTPISKLWLRRGASWAIGWKRSIWIWGCETTKVLPLCYTGATWPSERSSTGIISFRDRFGRSGQAFQIQHAHISQERTGASGSWLKSVR